MDNLEGIRQADSLVWIVDFVIHCIIVLSVIPFFQSSQKLFCYADMSEIVYITPKTPFIVLDTKLLKDSEKINLTWVAILTYIKIHLACVVVCNLRRLRQSVAK